jgi:hypothetical protein
MTAPQDLTRHELSSGTSDELNQGFQACQRIGRTDLNRIQSKREKS